MKYSIRRTICAQPNRWVVCAWTSMSGTTGRGLAACVAPTMCRDCSSDSPGSARPSFDCTILRQSAHLFFPVDFPATLSSELPRVGLGIAHTWQFLSKVDEFIDILIVGNRYD